MIVQTIAIVEIAIANEKDSCRIVYLRRFDSGGGQLNCVRGNESNPGDEGIKSEATNLSYQLIKCIVLSHKNHYPFAMFIVSNVTKCCVT